MHYNMYQGVQNDWREQLLSLPRQLRSRNWLPAAVAAGMGLWVALIVMNFQITGPPDLGAPSTAGKATAGQSIGVTSAVSSLTDAGINGGGTNMALQSNNVKTAPSNSEASNLAASSSTSTDAALLDEGDVIGGRGADEAPTPTQPSDPVTLPPASTSPVIGPIIVDPPIIDTDPITVDPLILPLPTLPEPDDLLSPILAPIL